MKTSCRRSLKPDLGKRKSRPKAAFLISWRVWRLYCDAPWLVSAGLAVEATAFSFWKKYSLS